MESQDDSFDYPDPFPLGQIDLSKIHVRVPPGKRTIAQPAFSPASSEDEEDWDGGASPFSYRSVSSEQHDQYNDNLDMDQQSQEYWDSIDPSAD